MELGLLLQPSSFSFKGKFATQTDEKSHRKWKAAKKLKCPGDFRRPRSWHSPCATRGGLCPACSPASWHVVLCFALDRDLCFGSTVLGLYWASFGSILDLVWPHLLYFLLTLSSMCVNLQLKPEPAETKCDRRNIGINCKIMQINPKIESKSFKNTHAYMTLITPPRLKLGLSLSKTLYKTE